MTSITETIRPWPKLQGEGHWVAVDTETTGLYVDDKCQRENCGCPGSTHITVVSLAGDGWSVAIPFDAMGTADDASEQVWAELLTWLSKQNLIMHHAKFDLDMFRRGAPHGWRGADLIQSVSWDTQLGCWVMWPLQPKGLKVTGERLWGKDERAEQLAVRAWLVENKHKEHELWYVPFNLLGPYARQDAALTYRLYEYQCSQINPGDDEALEIAELLQRELAVMRMLSKMEARGIGFDVDRANEIFQEIETEQKRLAAQLPFRPTRMQAIKWWSVRHQDVINSLPRTDTGAPSLDDDGREVLLASGIEFAEEFCHWLDLDLAKSRYYGDRDKIDSEGKRKASWKKLVGRDGRLRTDFQQDGTTSTRFSARRVNLQAIPKDITAKGRYPDVRQCFVPSKDKVLVELDLSQAEIRVAAVVAQCKSLRRIVVSGEDIHGSTAKLLFPQEFPGSPGWKKSRAIAKELNLMVQYGAGVKVIAIKIKCDEAQAEFYRNRYHTMFPEIKQTMRVAQHRAESRGYVILVSGRKRYFSPDEASFKAFNAVVQGNVSEAMKDWMLWIERVYPGRLLLQVHDSVVLELPEKQWVEITNDIANAGESQMSETFGIPMVVDRKLWQASESVESSKPSVTQEVHVA